MLRLGWRVGCRLSRSAEKLRDANRRISTSIKHEPLRVLFCGADEFSIYSLRALCDLQLESPAKVASIDVVCRPDKRVGRGLKQIQEVPIKHVAAELGLNLYQIDTFRNWNPPKSINLVIAVSFGLLVPARILNGAQYGGLNVHPSLLPDLRGPAPIIHTLLKRRAYTGVTLQTMHPTLFDHGIILAQTQSPGVPVPADSTPDSLLKTLSPLGAELLCRGINDATFVPPVKDVRVDFPEAQHADYAPKVTPEDRRINWTTWTSDEILLRDRVLGRLWDNKTYSECLPNRYPKRVTFQGPWHTLDHPGARFTAGTPLTIHGGDSKAATLAIMTNDGKAVSPASVTVEGERKGNGVEALLNGFAGG